MQEVVSLGGTWRELQELWTQDNVYIYKSYYLSCFLRLESAFVVLHVMKAPKPNVGLRKGFRDCNHENLPFLFF